MVPRPFSCSLCILRQGEGIASAQVLAMAARLKSQIAVIDTVSVSAISFESQLDKKLDGPPLHVQFLASMTSDAVMPSSGSSIDRQKIPNSAG
jgi:hypothetical protein